MAERVGVQYYTGTERGLRWKPTEENPLVAGAFVVVAGVAGLRDWSAAVPAPADKRGKLSGQTDISGKASRQLGALYLVSLQRILPRKGLSASAVTEIRLFAAVCFDVALQVMLAVEGEGAEVAGELSIRGCWVLDVAQIKCHV